MKILLAEDERSMSNALKAILTKNNYSVDAVYDGEEAASYALACEYDVIIMDIMMPKMNGIDSLKEIRKKGCTVPVIMLTAKSEVDDKVMGLDAGANDYLTKPFATKELLARLRALTRSPQVAADNSLHVGNLTLDRGTFELYTPSGKYRLAGKEFQMIEMLMATPGMLISTEKFMDKIWGIDSEADISVVWTYISFLRKKLVSLEANVQINAKRNAGYTLEAKGD
ncbi:MAG: response regulator transcription factor [Oscillospiraceae bacterium]|jgi:DNA-binding response OmpR family regulator|nr:response regulator transcription factor [Saccharofermentans sp.]MDO4875923.1 response regulator transcription factor [Oscillospiraceae bacterium]